MNKVVILMSTYNGEKYLSEQLDSICNQSFTEWILYIRDDGSSDQTVEIINEYCAKDNRILFDEENKNIGLVNSFFKLLKDHDADYYMFCDQDDYWKQDKVELSVNCMEKLDNQLPCLAHTDLEIVDQDLNNLSPRMKEKPYLRSLQQLSFVNNVTGCTIIMNQKLKDAVLDNLRDTKNIVVHDWWITLVASFCGNIRFINETTIKYRQHGNNVLGSNRKKQFFIKKLILKLSGNGGFTNDISRLLNQLIEFTNIYTVNKEGNQFLQDVNNIQKSNIFNRIQFLIRYKIVMETNMRSIEFYLLFLFSFKKFNL